LLHLEVRFGFAAHRKPKPLVKAPRRRVCAQNLQAHWDSPDLRLAENAIHEDRAHSLALELGQQLDLAYHEMVAFIDHLKQTSVHAVDADDLMTRRGEALLELLALGPFVPAPNRCNVLPQSLTPHLPGEDSILSPTLSKCDLAHRHNMNFADIECFH